MEMPVALTQEITRSRLGISEVSNKKKKKKKNEGQDWKEFV